MRATAGFAWRGDVERSEGGAMDSTEERLGEGACPKGLRVPEEGGHEPAGFEALKRSERPGGAGGFQKSLSVKLEQLGEEANPRAEVELWAEDEARFWA